MQFVLRARHGKGLRVNRGASVNDQHPWISGGGCLGILSRRAAPIFLDGPHPIGQQQHLRQSWNDDRQRSAGPMLLLLSDDSSPGRHDTLLCPCNALSIGSSDAVDIIATAHNLHEALSEFGIALPFTRHRSIFHECSCRRRWQRDARAAGFSTWRLCDPDREMRSSARAVGLSSGYDPINGTARTLASRSR